MSKEYKVSEKRLLELLVAENRLAALESGGVDNWEWYGDSLCDFLTDVQCEDFEEAAQFDLLREWGE